MNSIFSTKIILPTVKNAVSEALIWDRGNEGFWDNIFTFGKMNLIEQNRIHKFYTWNSDVSAKTEMKTLRTNLLKRAQKKTGWGVTENYVFLP